MVGKEGATIRAHSPGHGYSFIKQEMKGRSPVHWTLNHESSPKVISRCPFIFTYIIKL
jgi:hypothetical protein